MQTHNGSLSLGQTTFFTHPPIDDSVYQISMYLTVSGSGDGVTVNLFKNGTIGYGQVSGQNSTPNVHSDRTFHILLSEYDELSFSVQVDGTFTWSLELRLVRILDELTPLE